MSLLLLDTPASALFPPERGALSIRGTRFYREDGSLFQWRGYSWFLGFLRYMRGEDITPDLRWMQAFGFNMPRVFGPLPWKETPDYRIEHFDFVKFDAFLTLLESYGMRCNFSIAHYSGVNWKRFDTALQDVIRGHWNVVVERVNEPHVHGDPPEPGNPLDRRKPDPIEDFPTLKSYRPPTSFGYYKEALDGKKGWPLTCDFGTVHTPRDDAWPRKARIAQEAQDALGTPWINDEPPKIVEPGFTYTGGKNDPKQTPDEMVWYAAVSSLWMPGCTYHCEEGKWGRVPAPGMLQHTCAERLRDDVFLKIDASWQTGEYNRGGNGDSPVKNVYTEENQIWIYTSLHTDKALSVCCGDETLEARNGWTIKDSWCHGTLAKLER